MFDFFGTEMDFQSKICLSFELEKRCQENEENGAENLRLEILSSLKMHAFDRVSNYQRE